MENSSGQSLPEPLGTPLGNTREHFLGNTRCHTSPEPSGALWGITGNHWGHLGDTRGQELPGPLGIHWGTDWEQRGTRTRGARGRQDQQAHVTTQSIWEHRDTPLGITKCNGSKVARASRPPRGTMWKWRSQESGGNSGLHALP